MSLLAELGIGDEVNIGDVEKKLASGDLPPEGVHHAVLTQVGAIPNADGRGWKMTFEIIAGPGKGAQIEEVLWKPKGDDEKKDAKVKNRVLLFMHRLGLLVTVPGGEGKAVPAPGKHDFCDCLGATTFIEIKHEKREFEGKNGKREITEARITFGGLLAADDKKCKDVPKASGQAAAAAVSGKAAAATKAKDDLDGI